MIINDYGLLYRISKRNWKRYCKAYVETQGSVKLTENGAKLIGYVENDITDWREERYKEELGWL